MRFRPVRARWVMDRSFISTLRRSRPSLSPGIFIAAAVLFLAGCASPFPRATDAPTAPFADGLDAPTIFARTLAAHGGDLHAAGGDLNLAFDGQWDRLIQRIQPVVTDSAYRIRAEERYLPAARLHAVRWQGPAGTKLVVRTPDTIEIFYNGVRDSDDTRRRDAAMTADAFQLFHLGPSFLQARGATFTRLADRTERGVAYHRLHTTLRPGFGFSPADDVVVWIDPTTHRLFRAHLTLNGFETTQGAHVDTTFLAYRSVGPILVPAELNERVRAPLRINAHRWWITGADRNRGWTAADVTGPNFERTAAAPAISTAGVAAGGGRAFP